MSWCSSDCCICWANCPSSWCYRQRFKVVVVWWVYAFVKWIFGSKFKIRAVSFKNKNNYISRRLWSTTLTKHFSKSKLICQTIVFKTIQIKLPKDGFQCVKKTFVDMIKTIVFILQKTILGHHSFFNLSHH